MNKTSLPTIILKGIVLLPNNDIRLEFDNDLSKNIIDSAELFHDNRILVISRENELEETISLNELPTIGVLGELSHKMELPNGKTRIIITGLKRVRIHEFLNIDKKDEILETIVSDVEEKKLDELEETALIKKIKRELTLYVNAIPYVSNSILSIIDSIDDLNVLTDIAVSYISVEKIRLLDYLYETDQVNRVKMLLEDIYRELEMYKIEKEIDGKVKIEIDETQRQFLLKEKIKAIKKELGDTSIKENEIIKINNKIQNMNLPVNIEERINEEIERYESLTDTSPETNVVRNYIEWLTDIPWNMYTEDINDLKEIEKRLEETHSGLKEVKERFVEYIAIQKKSKKLNSPIICLVGPPGVGKTSFVYGLANAMNRKFVKISVGGLSDPAELVGHRRTYLGANPGRIIQSLKKAKSMNPIFLIDEIDKMTKSYKGDPASTLLEILDKEQNVHFSDNYIEEETDLSKVMFITTANYIEEIPEALKDRLEIIEMTGYTEFEKLEIAKTHIIPKLLKEHDSVNMIEIPDDIIMDIIRYYTKEAGVRDLERNISKIIRKVITKLIKNKIAINKVKIDEKSLIEFLGEKDYQEEKYEDSIGIVNGLAYTRFGGDITRIEVNLFKGNGKLELTGSLGDVMKESVTIALNYIKSNHKMFGIDYRVIKENDIHIHFPEGAVKKDGPSAGIAITTALISALTNSKVDKEIALTGEITLRGNILKIGGLKEKSIGALRNGIKKVYIPKQNESDIKKLPKEVLNSIKFITVDTYYELYTKLVEGV